MLTFTGAHVTQEFGAPSIRDIAVQSMRLVRFSGAADIFWPVGMHCLLVADLMPKTLEPPRLYVPDDGGVAVDPDSAPMPNPWLEVYSLLHDAAEVCVADVPRPMKTPEARAVEDRVQARIYASLGVPAPSDAIKAAIKEADFRAALAEGVWGCAGRGYEETQTGFRRDPEAEAILVSYLKVYDAAEALEPDGRWALKYEERLRTALREAQHEVSYAPDAEVTPAAVPAEAAESEARILQAITDLYRSQEHRPSCEAVQRVVMRALRPEVASV